MYLTAHNLPALFPEGLTGLVFDCDGVMFDTRDCNITYYNLILERLGLEPMTASQEDYVHMATVEQSLRHIIPQSRWDELGKARKSVSYTKEIMPRMVPEPGLNELLAMARELGLKLAVYTNRTNTMELVLDRFKLSSFFQPVITASKVQGKPSPEGMFRILDGWGARAGEVAFLGDSKADMLAAQRSGVPFFSFRNETLTADRHVKDFWQLLQALVGFMGHPAQR